MVNLYWNIGRIVTQDIQKNEKRAGYGEQLLDGLAKSLTQEYGRGYSVSNLNDMRRFFEDFQILQTLSVESSETKVRQIKSSGFETLHPLAAESLVQQISQTVSDQFHGGVRRFVARTPGKGNGPTCSENWGSMSEQCPHISGIQGEKSRWQGLRPENQYRDPWVESVKGMS